MMMAEWLGDQPEDNKWNYGKKSSCGTVGCIGGWTEGLMAMCMKSGAVAKGKLASARLRLRTTGSAGHRLSEAQDLLGITEQMANDLFFDRKLCEAEGQQTCTHARAVKRHIEAFQKKHAARLKAHKLPPKE